MKCQECKHDYVCCKKYGATLSLEEAKKDYDKKLVNLTENGLVIGLVFVLRKENGKCIYLDKNNLCTIYEKRPMACKTFDCAGRI